MRIGRIIWTLVVLLALSFSSCTKKDFNKDKVLNEQLKGEWILVSTSMDNRIDVDEIQTFFCSNSICQKLILGDEDYEIDRIYEDHAYTISGTYSVEGETMSITNAEESFGDFTHFTYQLIDSWEGEELTLILYCANIEKGLFANYYFKRDFQY